MKIEIGERVFIWSLGVCGTVLEGGDEPRVLVAGALRVYSFSDMWLYGQWVATCPASPQEVINNLLVSWFRLWLCAYGYAGDAFSTLQKITGREITIQDMRDLVLRSIEKA